MVFSLSRSRAIILHGHAEIHLQALSFPRSADRSRPGPLASTADPAVGGGLDAGGRGPTDPGASTGREGGAEGGRQRP